MTIDEDAMQRLKNSPTHQITSGKSAPVLAIRSDGLWEFDGDEWRKISTSCVPPGAITIVETSSTTE